MAMILKTTVSSAHRKFHSKSVACLQISCMLAFGRFTIQSELQAFVSKSIIFAKRKLADKNKPNHKLRFESRLNNN